MSWLVATEACFESCCSWVGYAVPLTSAAVGVRGVQITSLGGWDGSFHEFSGSGNSFMTGIDAAKPTSITKDNLNTLVPATSDRTTQYFYLSAISCPPHSSSVATICCEELSDLRHRIRPCWNMDPTSAERHDHGRSVSVRPIAPILMLKMVDTNSAVSTRTMIASAIGINSAKARPVSAAPGSPCKRRKSSG
jgi:hypothetical protein